MMMQDSDGDPTPPEQPVEPEFEDYRLKEGLIDFQALVREGDVIIYDLVAGSMQFNSRIDWWGQFQVPRNSPEDMMPEVGRYYMLHLKDGRCGTMIIDRCMKNINGRYPTIQFHGAGPLE